MKGCALQEELKSIRHSVELRLRHDVGLHELLRAIVAASECLKLTAWKLARFM